jgi:hypothetical protein
VKKFYVSLVKDLLGYYLEFEADEKETVRLYLRAEYFGPEWKLPWCSEYSEEEFESLKNRYGVKGVIKATCGPLKKEDWQ